MKQKEARRPIKYPIDDRWKNKNGTEIHFGLIALISILLPPLGVAMAVKKATQEKSHYYDNGRQIQLRSIVLLVFGVFGMVIYGVPEHDIPDLPVNPGLVLCAFYILLFAAAMIGGVRMKRKGLLYESVLALITLDKITGLDQIAKRSGLTYDAAIKTVQTLIDTHLLKDAYIHLPEREVIVLGISKKVAIRCKNCGGTSVLQENDPRKCVYCGGKI